MSTILFVEDEHSLRSVFSEFLRNEGFVVLQAADLAEALLACANYSDPIDLSIIDEKEGMLAAKRLKDMYPAMRILFLGTPARQHAKQAEKPESAWIAKPFTSADLLDAVRAITRAATPRAQRA